MSAVYATEAERAAALRVAASVLQTRWRSAQAFCRVTIGPNTLDAHAQADWAGVVRVTMRHTGEVLAESLPGRPYTMASGTQLDGLLPALAAIPGAGEALGLIANALTRPALAGLSGAELGLALHDLVATLEGGAP